MFQSYHYHQSFDDFFTKRKVFYLDLYKVTLNFELKYLLLDFYFYFYFFFSFLLTLDQTLFNTVLLLFHSKKKTQIFF